ncbi:MAG: DinB family protein [Acidobacteriaceae bacterium]
MSSSKSSITDRENGGPGDLSQGLIESYVVNERMNQIVLAHLDPAAWRAPLPGKKTRTIAAIVTHVHNMRRKWIRLSAPHLGLPVMLDRAKCTQEQARADLAESAARCTEMLRHALSHPGSTVFLRDGWSKPWPVGAAMVTYMISHEAHHRGQVCMLAHQLGFPLPVAAGAGIWAWEKLWKECGFPGLR